MKRALVLGFVGVLMVSAPGCGGSEAENLTKQMIADTNALADAIEKKEPTDKIKAAAEKLKATGEKAKNLKTTKDEDEQLKKKYEQPLKDALKRLAEAAAKNPEGAAAVGGAMMGAVGP